MLIHKDMYSGATYASTAPLTSSNKPDQDRRYALDRFVT